MSEMIGVDIGYGFVKVMNGIRGFSFPSVVGLGHSKSILRAGKQDLQPVNSMRLGVEGSSYFVGRSALRNSRFAHRNLSLERNGGKDFDILFFAALSLFCAKPSNSFKIVTGLPVDHMHMADELSSRLKGSRRVSTFNNGVAQEVEILVVDVDIIPQPLGTYFLQASGDGDQDSSRGPTGIVDIGFKTMDLAVIEDGDFVTHLGRSISLGLSTAYNDVEKQLMARYGLEKGSHSLDEAVTTGKIFVAGQERDITDIVNSAFKSLAANIVVEINSTWQTNTLNTIYLTGGGGKALGSHILPDVRQMRLVPDAMAANCHGYLKWGQHLWGVDDWE